MSIFEKLKVKRDIRQRDARAEYLNLLDKLADFDTDDPETLTKLEELSRELGRMPEQMEADATAWKEHKQAAALASESPWRQTEWRQMKQVERDFDAETERIFAERQEQRKVPAKNTALSRRLLEWANEAKGTVDKLERANPYLWPRESKADAPTSAE